MTYFTYDDDANAFYIAIRQSKQPKKRTTETVYRNGCMINVDLGDCKLEGIEIILPQRSKKK